MLNPLHRIIGAIISNKNPDSIPAAYKELAAIARFKHDTISKYISYYNDIMNYQTRVNSGF